VRYTPAGVPLARFSLAHVSRQTEAGGERRVEAEIRCVAFEADARRIGSAPLGIGLRLAGFVAPQGRATRQLVLHVTEMEFIEGA